MLTRRSFFSAAGSVAFGTVALALSGCGGSRSSTQLSTSASASSSTSSAAGASTGSVAQSSAPVATSASSSVASASSSTASSAGARSNSLVVYFSHTGENYGVGFIEEGNTAIVASMIAAKTGADAFEIVPAQAYPQGYNECCDVALEEQHAGARPAYQEDIDISAYDTVYLGYPIWWGDLPMCVYTFLESHDWAGKTIHPFCTHAGSGLSGTPSKIQSTCAGVNVGEGLAISGTTAQNSRDQAEASVDSWLS